MEFVSPLWGETNSIFFLFPALGAATEGRGWGQNFARIDVSLARRRQAGQGGRTGVHAHFALAGQLDDVVHDRGGNVAHQREIEVENELDDIFIVRNGLSVQDKFVLDGARQVHDADQIEFEELKPEQAFANLKFHAE